MDIKKKYELHSYGLNWFHFRSKQTSTIDSFSVTYCHDGTVVMHGDYGCLAWQRNWFPKHIEYGFPCESTGIDYFASKVVRASDSQKIKEWKQKTAVSDIEAYIKYSIEYGDDDDDFNSFNEILVNLKSCEYNESEFVSECFERNIDSEAWSEFGIDYTNIFKHKFECLKAVSAQILNVVEINTPDKWVKHVIKEGSREHILYYDTQGTHCSCKNCEVNKHVHK